MGKPNSWLIKAESCFEAISDGSRTTPVRESTARSLTPKTAPSSPSSVWEHALCLLWLKGFPRTETPLSSHMFVFFGCSVAASCVVSAKIVPCKGQFCSNDASAGRILVLRHDGIKFYLDPSCVDMRRARRSLFCFALQCILGASV